MTRTIFICLICLLFAVGCEERKRGYYYKDALLDVNCGEKLKGEIYRLGHTTASIYSILYENKAGHRIELPLDGCVKIEIESYPSPIKKRK